MSPDGVIYNTSIVGGIICPYIKEFYKEIKLPRWKPEYRGDYYFITIRGEILRSKWYGTVDENLCFDFGNCFRTQEEAEVARDKIKEILIKE